MKAREKSYKRISSSISFVSTYVDETTGFSHSSSEDEDSIEELINENVSELCYEHVDEVRKLFNEELAEIYNLEDPLDAIHRCCLSKKITNSKNEIVAAMCMDEHPNIPALPLIGWSCWAENIYNIKDITSYNSFWIHCCVFARPYKKHFLTPILNEIFHQFFKKKYIIFIVPKNCHHKMNFLNGITSLVLPKDYKDPMTVQTLRICARSHFVTQYKIRRAVEEDNDDLVPLIHEFSPRFVELYGEFYIAEIITRHPEAGRKVIVAENKGEAVSVMCLNPQVNYEQLNNSFDLQSFMGLYKIETAHQVAKKPKKVQKTQSSTHSLGQTDKSGQKKQPKSKSADINNVYLDISSGDEEESISSIEEKNPTFSVLDDIDNLTREHSSASVIDFPIDGAQSELYIQDEDVTYTSDTTSSELPYAGSLNAFAIEIFAAQPKHNHSLILLLVSCFESYPDRDFGLLMVPHGQDFSEILHFFVRVQPNLTAQHPHELYIFFRGALSNFSVKIAYDSDAERVNNFLSFLKYPGNIKQNFEDGISGKKDILTMLAIGGENYAHPIGLAQVSKVTDLNAMKMKYAMNLLTDIRHDRNFSFGYCLVVCMSTLFKRNLKFFLREIHRKSGFQTLFYGVNSHDAMDYRIRPLSFIMKDMWLVPPRKILLHANKPIHEYPEEPYALFISTPKLCCKDFVQINHRIIIVGASSTALAFLGKLLYTETNQFSVFFNNVTLVSIDGLGKINNINPIRDMLLARHSLVDRTYLEKIGLRAKISIITGTLTGINRKEQKVIIDKKVFLPYEFLFLMTGLQYGVPHKKGVKNYINMKLPKNCFTINTERDGDNALATLHNLVTEQKKTPYEIIVYGHTIDCYCCIEALLEYGVPANCIIFIDPWPTHITPTHNNHDFVFQDGDIYNMVLDTIQIMGIEIKTGYKLIDWTLKPPTLKFESKTRFLVMSPLCAFIYNKRSVNVNTFNAIYESGLVFDGRLVIDTQCQTNDPKIYAAGPLTKYSRKLFAENLVHKYFNSEEIGGILGRKIRNMVIPMREKFKNKLYFGKSCWQPWKNLIPFYFKPLMTYARLPGGLHYLQVTKPGKQIPLETAMSDNDYGSVLSTGNCNNLRSQGYFRVHLNIYRTIETLTCLSFTKFDYKKLVFLWGKHEAMFNNLVQRFESLYITDLFEYFQKPWSSAIFLDDFSNLESDIMKVMTSLTTVDGESPIEDLYSAYMDTFFQKLSYEDRTRIYEKFVDSGYDKAIQKLVMDYIRDNLSVLDMYAHPVIVNYILSGYEESPMFKKI